MDSQGRIQIRFNNAYEQRQLHDLQEETGKGEGTSLKALLHWWHKSGKPPLEIVPNSEGEK